MKINNLLYRMRLTHSSAGQTKRGIFPSSSPTSSRQKPSFHPISRNTLLATKTPSRPDSGSRTRRDNRVSPFSSTEDPLSQFQPPIRGLTSLPMTLLSGKTERWQSAKGLLGVVSAKCRHCPRASQGYLVL